MTRARHAFVPATVAAALFLCACSGDSDSGRAPPTDEVVDESAGEDAIAVLEGDAPGVAIIVEYPDGTDVDPLTEALRDDYSLNVTSRYHDIILGAAFIAPDEETVAALVADPRVLGVVRDQLASPRDGDSPAMADEMTAHQAEAAALGEVESEGGGSEGAADKDYPVVKKIEPQRLTTGWKLVRGALAPGAGEGMLVAVLDSGVDYTHPDLSDAVHPTLGKDCVRRKNKTVMDLEGHGSSVSGIIAARNNDFGIVGVAPLSTILPVRVLDAENSGTVSSLLCGLDYVARRTERVDVVNYSIQRDCGDRCDAFELGPDHKALRKLVDRGVFVAVCAGNFGIDATHSSPAFLEEVVTVSAYLDWDGKISTGDRYAHFSNFGSIVDLGAPGAGIMSTTVVDGKSVYKRKNGTSFATPFVAGAAAVYKAAYGGDPAKIRTMLLEDARTSYPGRGGDHPERLLVFRDPTGAAGCGDGECLGGEGHENCPVDCGCEARGCDDVSPVGCHCDPACVEEKDCCSDAATYCQVE